MMSKALLLSVASAIVLAGSATLATDVANAQVPALLPNKATVPAGEPLEIDGVWRISEIGKRIRIEGGRAYALDPWIHAMVFQILPDMVVVNNLRKTGDGVFVGYDLPLMGNATLRLVSPDRIDVTVPGLLGISRYTLVRVSGGAGDGQPQVISGGGGEPPRAPGSPAAPAAFDAGEVDLANFKPVAIPATKLPTVKSGEAFLGCAMPDPGKDGEAAGHDAPAPSSPTIDRITKRRFASLPAEEAKSQANPAEGLCWKRLDGAWREVGQITLDRSRDDGRQWNVEGTELAQLTNGSYTTPDYLFIPENGVSDSEIYVMSALDGADFVRFASSDGTSLDDVLRPQGPRKTYVASADNRLGHTLTIDVTASNRIRIRIDNREFLRPAPGVSRADMNSQTPANDAFLIGYNMENLSASRRGYDVLNQDPFFLLQNDKLDVFAQAPATDYVIEEKRTVPLGFTLIKEDMQGNVFRKTLVSSEKEAQDAISNSYGWNAKISVSGAANTLLSLAGKKGEIADTSLSVGYDNVKESMQSMRSSDSVGEVMGFSRAKQYALVVDEPFVTLSKDFIDAIGDAERYGDYASIIRKFGTHYAYAVTYGAAAKMTQEISEQSYSHALSESEGNSGQAQLNIMESGIGGYISSSSSTLSGTSGSIGNEGGKFVAVGGNGSWDQSGYAKGDTPYPILLDLRPLDELLNPLNFPDQPEIYSTVRANLALAINHYLAGHTRPLRNDRLIDRVTYTGPTPDAKPAEPIEEWHIYVPKVTCTKRYLGTSTGAEGTMRITATGPKNTFAPAKTLTVACKWKEPKSTNYDYKVADSTPGLLILRGTRSQISQYKVSFEFNWKYKPGFQMMRDSTMRNNTAMQKAGLPVGQSQTVSWGIGPKARPELRFEVRLEHYANHEPGS